MRIVLTITLLIVPLLIIGCGKGKKGSGVPMRKAKFMLGPTTLNAQLPKNATWKKHCGSGCKKFTGGGWQIIFAKSSTGSFSVRNAKVPKTMADAVKAHGGKPSALKKRKLKGGYIVSGGGRVVSWKAVDEYSTIFCDASHINSKNKQAALVKICESVVNPYNK